ncbi:MAG: nucleotidyltransferase domain-containing protein [Butyrivibrio sp.]
MNEYYTVSQYAEIYGKDPGNIRRMLMRGTLEGEKIGNQWLIPKGTEYPKDRRIRSGGYRNWRQRVRFNSKHPEMLKKLCKMCDAFGEVYGRYIEEVILYGSYARGQETDESDVDMALVLTDAQTEEQYDRMTDIVVDYQLDLGVTISVISIEKREFKEWKTTLPFYKKVEKEGIVIWKSA